MSLPRIEKVLRQIQYAIPKTKDSVEEGIMKDNIDKAILGIANFLGSKLRSVPSLLVTAFVYSLLSP